MLIYIIVLLVIIILCSVILNKSGGAAKKTTTKKKTTTTTTKSSINYLFLPQSEIDKIKSGEKKYHVRYPKSLDGTEWAKCKNCEIIFFVRPSDSPPELTPEQIYKRYESSIVSRVHVKITNAHHYKTIDELFSDNSSAKSEEDSLRTRLKRSEELGGVVLLTLSLM